MLTVIGVVWLSAPEVPVAITATRKGRLVLRIVTGASERHQRDRKQRARTLIKSMLSVANGFGLASLHDAEQPESAQRGHPMRSTAASRRGRVGRNGQTSSFRTGIVAALSIDAKRWQAFGCNQLDFYLVPLAIVCGIGWAISKHVLIA